MAAADRIESFDDVEQVQQQNEVRFEEVRGAIDELAAQTSSADLEISERCDRGVEDLRQLIREDMVRLRESEKLHKEQIAALFAKSDRIDAQLDRTEAVVAETAKETAKTSKETAKTSKEVAAMSKEVAAMSKEVAAMSRKLKQTGIEVGNIGNSRGEFIEHLAMPSIKRIVKEQLQADFLGGFRGGSKGKQVQIDAWATSEQENAVYVFEIKRKFRDDAIRQVFAQIERLRTLLPDYASSAIYPFIAAGVISEADEQKVWQAGVHLLKFGDGAFRLCEPPAGFDPEPIRGMKGHARMVPPYPHYLKRLSESGESSVAVH